MVVLGTFMICFVIWAFIALLTEQPLRSVLYAAVAIGMWCLLLFGIAAIAIGLQANGVITP